MIYDLQIQLFDLTEEDRFEISLSDSSYAAAEHGKQEVRVFNPDLQIGSGLQEGTVGEFLDDFGSGKAGASDGMVFGRWLLSWLLGDQEIRSRWEKALLRAGGERPIRVALAFDVRAYRRLGILPFELLADSTGFIFRRFGNALIRTFLQLDSKAFEITKGMRFGYLWANPDDPGLDLEVFQEHGKVIEETVESLDLEMLPALGNITRQDMAVFSNEQEAELVSIVAHGASSGGMIILHEKDHAQYPGDPGEPISGQDFSQMLKKLGVEVAFLWSCHGAHPHPLHGAVSESLLRSGNVACVVGSHVALRADTTPDLARGILSSLKGAAGGHLDKALTEARVALSEDDLQWASLAYYARPSQGRSVTLSDRVRADLDRQNEEAEVTQGVEVKYAPDLVVWFCGREEEVRRGVAKVKGQRLVSITGLPGTGKTEVARAIAGKIAEEGFIDDAVWVTLDGVQTVEMFLFRVAVFLGFEKCESVEDLGLALGSRRLLLVLDNAEDLIGPDQLRFQKMVGVLLRMCPEVRFLLSSRRVLGDPVGLIEDEMKVEGLENPYDRDAFVAAAGERLRPEDFGSSELDALIILLDGHPRSLMLVAGQVGRGRTLGELYQRLMSDEVAAVTTHELMGTVLEEGSDAELKTKRLISSLNLALEPLLSVDPEAAETFMWLGYFPAGLPQILMEPLFGERAEEIMVSLLRHGLVQIRGRERRLILPAPLRWYATMRAEALATDIRREFLQNMGKTIREYWMAYRQLIGTSESENVAAIAVREIANLRKLLILVRGQKNEEVLSDIVDACLSWAYIYKCIGRAQSALEFLGEIVDQGVSLRKETLASLFQSLDDLQRHTSSFEEAQKSYEEVLPIYGAIDAGIGAFNTLQSEGDLQRRKDRLGGANTLKEQGDHQMRMSRLEEAQKSYEEALLIYRTIDARLGEANTLRALGDLQVRRSRLEEAQKSYEEALPIYRAIEDRLGESNTLGSLGDLQMRTDRLEEAQRNYEEALPIYRAIEARMGEANMLQALGDLQVRRSRLEEAQKNYEETLPIYRAIADRLGEANTLRALGDLQVRTDRLEEAQKSYEEALPIYRAIEDRLGEANTLQALGDLQVRRSRQEEAQKSYEEALPIYRAIEDRLGEANTLRALGDLQVRTDRLEEAQKSYEEALPIYRAIEARMGEANTLLALGDLQVRRSRLEEAQKSYEEALPIYRAIEDRLGEANTLNGMGNLMVVSDQPDLAFESFQKAMIIQEEIRNDLGWAASSGYLGRLCLKLQEWDRAIIYCGRTWNVLRSIEDRFGQGIALMDVAQACMGKEENEVGVQALYLSWRARNSIADPGAVKLEAFLGKVLEDFDPGIVNEELVASCELGLEKYVRETEEEFRKNYGDPDGPLVSGELLE